MPRRRLRLSVIIPTWMEEAGIEAVVRCALAIGDEVIVVDAGSTDGTARIARAQGALVVAAPKGRGHQLHAGALAATGDALLFLHADSQLPPASRVAIEAALLTCCGGNFQLRFEPDCGTARVFTALNHLRRRLMRVYYGDSGIFVLRSTYEALGGFKAIPLMEDYEFVRRLERYGRTAYVTDVCISTSGRRYEGRVVGALASWIVIQSLFSLGVSPASLVRLYSDVRGSAGRLTRRATHRLSVGHRKGSARFSDSDGSRSSLTPTSNCGRVRGA